MKIRLIIVLIFLSIFSSCNQDNSIQKVWISSTWTSSKDSKKYKLITERIYEEQLEDSEAFLLHLDSMYKGIYGDKLIYEFEEDSLTITHFNETLYYGFDRDKVKYELKFDSIYTQEGIQNRELRYAIEQLTRNKLILSFYLKESFLQENVITFQPLKTFNRKINKSDLEELLIDNEFAINIDSTSIIFTAPKKYAYGKVIPSNSKNVLDLKVEDYWYITIINNELFLILDSQVMHIREIQDERILGLIYGNENMELSLTRIKKGK